MIDISRLTIPLPRLPAEFDQYQITQISDFHLGSYLDVQALIEIVDMVNRLESDLIAITGDYISAYPERYTPSLIHALSTLSANDAVVAVMGNHDYITGSRKIREILQESNIIELNNRIHPIQRNSSFIYVAGVDDPMTEHDDLPRVIEQIPDENTSVILLAHEPDFADISAKSGKFDMQISGHTHGGQICLPLLGPLYLPRQGRKYPSGKYMVDKMVLYTNRGLGTSWFKIRYKCPPEITVFTLQHCTS